MRQIASKNVAAVRSAIANWLPGQAGWLVALSWLLLAVTVCAALVLFFGTGRWLEAHPQHEYSNFVEGEIILALVAVVVGLPTALVASVAILNGGRATASALVLLCWGGLLVVGAICLAWIPRGPETFDKFAGSQLFRVPWQFYPGGADSPTRGGFDVFLCLGSLRAIYDESCRGAQRVTILPAENGIDSWDERIWQWKYQLGRISPVGEQAGYQVSAEAGIHYYRRNDSYGKLNCLMICQSGSCRRQARIGSVVVDYPLSESGYLLRQSSQQNLPPVDFSEYDGVDQKLFELVNRWAVR